MTFLVLGLVCGGLMTWAVLRLRTGVDLRTEEQHYLTHRDATVARLRSRLRVIEDRRKHMLNPASVPGDNLAREARALRHLVEQVASGEYATPRSS